MVIQFSHSLISLTLDHTVALFVSTLFCFPSFPLHMFLVYTLCFNGLFRNLNLIWTFGSLVIIGSCISFLARDQLRHVFFEYFILGPRTVQLSSLRKTLASSSILLRPKECIIVIICAAYILFSHDMHCIYIDFP